ncbi:MAG: hypothetical protein KZQ94_22670 [Candidatus Thiodiazotropha sp. (ex Troendleina suluensis)]|nr:hypothetical protein [Candidatus Thiodiazotropha sp. (ex Troendleina suluensis)]
MPSITRKIDLSKGITLPIRVKGPEKTIRTTAAFSLSAFESQISSALARRLSLLGLGYTHPLFYEGLSRIPLIFYQVDVEIIVGGMGRPIYLHPIPQLKVIKNELDFGIGLVFGLQLMQRGIFTLNAQTFSFSL